MRLLRGYGPGLCSNYELRASQVGVFMSREGNARLAEEYRAATPAFAEAVRKLSLLEGVATHDRVRAL